MSEFYTYIKKYGNRIFHRGYKDGLRFSLEETFKPSFFINQKEASEWKTLYGHPVKKLLFNDINSAEQFYKKYEDVSGLDIHGNKNYGVQFAHDRYSSIIDYDPKKIKTGFCDIETNSDTIKGFPFPEKAEHEIVAVTFVTSENKIFCLTRKPFILKKEIENYTFEHICEPDERKFLLSLLSYMEREDFDILSGWFCNGFDFPYIYNRIVKLFGEKTASRMSPVGIVKYRNYMREGKIIHDCNIYGLQCLDFMEIFKKFGYAFEKQENYKLDTIAELVLGENKTDYSEYGTLNNLYKKNPQLYIEYNINDAMLPKRMNDKLGFMNTALALAYKAKTNYAETLGTVEMWDSIIYGTLLERKICVPKMEFQNANDIEGAFVKEPIPGLYDWVVTGDFASLYPYTIYQFNISPETIRGRIETNLTKLLEEDYPDLDYDNFTLTAGGHYFDKNSIGIIPELIKIYLDERNSVKAEYIKLEQDLGRHTKLGDKSAEFLNSILAKIILLEGRQLAIKILMNSLYGALASGAFRYYDPRLAEAVTLTGQLLIKTSEKILNDYLNEMYNTNIDYILYIDTDSVKIKMAGLVENELISDKEKVKVLDKFFENKITPLLNSSFEKSATNLGCKNSVVRMKREGIASKILMVKKKRYAELILNSEGIDYEEPKLKITGLASKRSDTPTWIRNLIKQSVKLILTSDESSMQEFIARKKIEYLSLDYDKIAKPQSVSDLDKYCNSNSIFNKGTPRQVKAALFYNHLLEKLEISDNYEKIYNKDKIKYVNLITPNALNIDVIGFITAIPEEFGLQEYIDYGNMWNITYIKPITDLLDVCNWTVEQKNSIFDIFDNF